MADNIAPSVEVKKWLDILAPVNPRVPLMMLFLEVATICIKLKENRSKDLAICNLDPMEIERLTNQAVNLDHRLDDWYQRNNLAVSCQLTLGHHPEWTSAILKLPGAPKPCYSTPASCWP